MASPEKTGRGCTTWVLGWLAFVALVCAAPWILCALLTKRLDVGAREQFSREQSCPEDRIQVRARPEVKPSDAFFGTDRREPPSEVARDPARLAIWQKGERERAEDWNARFEPFEVRGCGAQVLYLCSHPGDADGSTYPGLVSCMTATDPSGPQRPW